VAKKTQAEKATKVTPRGVKVSGKQEGSAKAEDSQASAAPTTKPGDAKQSTTARQNGTQAGTRKKSRMSGLDAAAVVLAEVGKPINCKELIERVFAKGLWTTSGKTPAATIHAAMIREIRDKGAKSRFRKHRRGTFVIAAKPTK
jgi:hypothetical protein